jgi:hypothetical protein
MMEAARSSKTLVYIQLRTLQYIPEGSELHTPLGASLPQFVKNHRLTIVAQWFCSSCNTHTLRLFHSSKEGHSDVHAVLRPRWHIHRRENLITHKPQTCNILTSVAIDRQGRAWPTLTYQTLGTVLTGLKQTKPL